jgi:hypothetical protein
MRFVHILSILLAFSLGVFANAMTTPTPVDTWQSVMPSEPPDVCSLMDEHLATPGNWASIETQVNEDCGLRFIVELGTGPIDGVDFGDVFQTVPDDGPSPTPAPPSPFNIHPDSGIDPSQTGGAF